MRVETRASKWRTELLTQACEGWETNRAMGMGEGESPGSEVRPGSPAAGKERKGREGCGQERLIRSQEPWGALQSHGEGGRAGGVRRALRAEVQVGVADTPLQPGSLRMM